VENAADPLILDQCEKRDTDADTDTGPHMPAFSMDWIGDLNFKTPDGEAPLELHSSTSGMLSPTEVLAYAVMACMAMDVVHVLTKGRHDLKALRVRFDGERAAEPPRRYVSMKLHFDITGAVEDHVVERAIKLSREKYCSVSNTLDPQMPFETGFTIAR
jgi:putative redox protein